MGRDKRLFLHATARRGLVAEIRLQSVHTHACRHGPARARARALGVLAEVVLEAASHSAPADQTPMLRGEESAAGLGSVHNTRESFCLPCQSAERARPFLRSGRHTAGSRECEQAKDRSSKVSGRFRESARQKETGLTSPLTEMIRPPSDVEPLYRVQWRGQQTSEK